MTPLLDQIVTLHQAGDFTTAEPLYRDALRQQPEHPDLWHLFALCLHQLGRPAEALSAADRAITLWGAVAEFHNTRGMILRALGRLTDAASAYRRAIALEPRSGDAHFNLGNTLQAAGRLEEALGCYQRVVELQPQAADAHFNLATLLQERRQDESASRHFEAALALRPDYAEAHANYAALLREADRWTEAAAHCRHALALRPDYAAAWINLGAIEQARLDLPAAVGCFERARALAEAAQDRKTLGLALRNLGVVLQMQGRLEDAAHRYQIALTHEPTDAEAHWGLALLDLQRGQYRPGWAGYEWRWRLPDYPSPWRPFPQPLWQGEPLRDRTILLHAEQGLGDTVQFARYVPWVAQQGAHVILECQPPLKTLLAGLSGVAQAIGLGEPLPPFDVHCPLLSLPRLFDTSLETIPRRVPYLRAPSSPGLILPTEPGVQKVGLAWAGNPRHKQDRTRSLPLRLLDAWFDLPRIRWCSLQVDPRADDQALLRQRPGLLDLSPHLRDLAATAALIAQLDLVISADTCVAHLAGALGKPVWILLAAAPDWRWLRDRSDSPWYPTARLFRQTVLGDWSHPLQAVAQALRQF